MVPLEFEWDSANVDHIARHGLLPREAEEVIRNRPLELGASIDRGELRITLVGVTDTGRFLVVIVTARARGQG